MSNQANQSPDREYKIYIPNTRQFVPVTKEIYYEYYRPIWRIQKRAQAHGQCLCTKNNVWKCDGDCLVCPFHTAGEMLSLDVETETDEGATRTLLDNIEDLSANIENALVYNALLTELFNELHELDQEGRHMCTLLMNGHSEREAAEIMNIARSTFKRHWDIVKASLYEKLKDYR